jgi:uncharacterized protein (TIGR02145 family)
MRLTLLASIVLAILVSCSEDDNKHEQELYAFCVDYNVDMCDRGHFDKQHCDGVAQDECPTGFYIIGDYNPPSSSSSETAKCTSSSSIAANHFCDFRDGRVYKKIRIGSQTWMAENLDYDTTGSVCLDCKKYGRLYNWETAIEVCPDGWHISSEAEWGILIDFVDRKSGTLKTRGDWNECGRQGDPYVCEDVHGFAALPGGKCNAGGGCSESKYYGYWWTANSNEDYKARCQNMHYTGYAVVTSDYKSMLFSVRCIQNE